MQRCVLIIFTNAAAGREAEYLDWYDRHLNHMVEFDDCISAQHFRRVDYQAKVPEPGEGGPHKFMAIYEFETNDVPATQKRLSAVMGSAAMPESDAKVDTDGWYFAPITDKREKAPVNTGD